jgi:hypothetical protein
VRFPYSNGEPARFHWRDLFLETYSATKPREVPGWMATSRADVLLWGQVSLKEDSVNCWAFPFARLKAWTRAHWDELPEREVPNVIDGFAHVTRGVLASINKVCRDLKVEGFRVDHTGLISDLFGKPLLRFMNETPQL